MQQQPVPPVAAGQAGQQYVGAVYAHGQYEWNAAQQKWEWKAKDNRALVAQQQQQQQQQHVQDLQQQHVQAQATMPQMALQAMPQMPQQTHMPQQLQPSALKQYWDGRQWVYPQQQQQQQQPLALQAPQAQPQMQHMQAAHMQAAHAQVAQQQMAAQGAAQGVHTHQQPGTAAQFTAPTAAPMHTHQHHQHHHQQQQQQPFRLMANQPIAAQPQPVQAVAAPPQQAGAAAAWPPSLKAYAERAFRSVEGDAARRQLMQLRLKAAIKEAKEAGQLWQKDWDTMALPDVGAPTGGAGDGMSYARAASGGQRSGWGAVRQLGRAGGAVAAHTSVGGFSAGGGLGAWGVVHHRAGSGAGPYGGDDDVGAPTWAAAPLVDGKGGKKAKGSNKGKKGKRGKKRGHADVEDDDAYNDACTNPAEMARRQRRAAKYGQGAAEGAVTMRSSFAAYQPRVKRHEGVDDNATLEEKEVAWDTFTVKGASEALEKSYFRLTSAPDPATVRPSAVLERALAHVLAKHEAERDYFWTCDQLKAMRQDLTVQRIRSALTVRVYEEHARLAVLNADVVNYNQCATQLLELYRSDLEGCKAEFAAYRVLYCLATSDLNAARHVDTLNALKTVCCGAQADELMTQPCVRHALDVRKAVYANAYVTLWRLARESHNLNAVFVEQILEKCRFAALNTLVRSYRPSLTLAAAARMLGFIGAADNEGKVEGNGDGDGDGASEAANANEVAAQRDMEALAAEYLRAHGAVLAEGNKLDCKESVGKLAVPEPEEQVAHGSGADATISVENFLSKSVGS